MLLLHSDLDTDTQPSSDRVDDVLLSSAAVADLIQCVPLSPHSGREPVQEDW